jgi:hypothetical protein
MATVASIVNGGMGLRVFDVSSSAVLHLRHNRPPSCTVCAESALLWVAETCSYPQSLLLPAHPFTGHPFTGGRLE